MKSKLFTVSLMCLTVIGTGACTNEEFFSPETGKKELSLTGESTAPVVRTDPEPVSILSGTVTMKGYVDSEGGSRVRLRGFAYSDTTSMPTLNDRKVYVISGDFQRKISGLTNGVEYSIRAFAINSTDTAYGAPVKVTVQSAGLSTLPVVNRVRRAAVVCGQFIEMEESSVMKEYGICLSRTPNPTLEDVREKAPNIDTQDVKGSFGVFFDDLEPQTMYHVRAYAIQNNGDVIYGNDRIFQTTKGGQVTSYFWNGDYCLSEDPAAYERIKQAIDSALYYYNNYSNLVKHINYNYSPGTPTADCNIEGWMRFGTNSRYQWVGTAQHEISHAMGVGTASNWGTLIQINGDRKWFKPKALQALRVMLKDMSANLYGDGMHFWPGGINQREEVSGARDLKANAIILNAMREDGMTNW